MSIRGKQEYKTMSEPLNIKCVEPGCDIIFEFSVGSQEYYAKRGFPHPKRCQTHRALKRQRIEEHNRRKNSPFNSENWQDKRGQRTSDREMLGE